MRTLQLFVLLFLLSSLLACGAKQVSRLAPTLTLKPTGFKASVHRFPDTAKQNDLDFLDVYDPWERLNRNIYAFNAGFDEYFMLPITQGYKAIVPPLIRTGVDNALQNANELPRLVNCLLQGKIEKGAITLSRFIINTTFGIGGLFDLASNNEKLPRQREDIGKTLGVWGIGSGPYFVIPFLGPSNLRDTIGLGGDSLLLLVQMQHVYDVLGIKDTRAMEYTMFALRSLNLRSHIAFTYYETGSPFEYEMVRFIYSKKRELDIKRR